MGRVGEDGERRTENGRELFDALTLRALPAWRSDAWPNPDTSP